MATANGTHSDDPEQGGRDSEPIPLDEPDPFGPDAPHEPVQVSRPGPPQPPMDPEPEPPPIPLDEA